MKTLQQTSVRLAFTIVLTAFACFSCHIVTAQHASNGIDVKNDSAETLVAVNTPVHPKSNDSSKMVAPKFDQDRAYKDIENYLIDQVEFPIEGIETGQSGMMKVRFQIMEDGSMQHFQFIESPGAYFEKQVLDALDNAPKWTPALQDGKSIAIAYQLNINFKLQ